MCGVIALLLANADEAAAPEIYEALNVLQHRGQDAAGIVTCRKGRLYQVKGNGLVRDVFSDRHMAQLLGNLGVGHVRYPTAGSSSPSEAQPFYVNSPYGIVLAHNGNLTNAKELTVFMEDEVHRHINTDSDSEVLLNILANNLQQTGKHRVNEEDIFAAITSLHQSCRGGYACVGMITGFGIIGFRDPNGIRPLIYGAREGVDGAVDYIVASESVCISTLGFKIVADVRPGEAVIITKQGSIFKRVCVPTPPAWTPCLFEYVYFARPDSILDGVSVYRARMAMGDALAKLVASRVRPGDIDVVVPVPDTARTAACEMATALNLPYREGFIKNRYVGRTFIMPGQQQRKKAVRRKLNAMALEFENRNVILVDDSIVRGTTSKEIIMMAREAGAKKVYFASCAPAIRFPNVYGIDMPTREELVAHNRNEDQIAAEIGADAVFYLDLESLKAAVSRFNKDITAFECSVFNGEYITGDVSEDYLNALRRNRHDASKGRQSVAGADINPMGLHNGLMQNGHVMLS